MQKVFNFHQRRTFRYHQIKQLDYTITGENRMTSLKDHLKKGFVYVEKGKVLGLYVPSFVDGLIVSDNEKVGIELMKFRLKSFNKAILPINNTIGNNFLLAQNHTPHKTERRMRYGKERKVQFDKIYNRIGGKLG